MTIVATCLTAGESFGFRYQPEHVYRIFSQIEAHCGQAFRTALVTNVSGTWPEIDEVIRPGAECWPGWWGKLHLFQWAFPERVLYLGLDTAIRGDVTALLDHDPGEHLDILLDVGNRRYPMSAVFCWDGKPRPHLTKNVQEGRHEFRSDQEWITAMARPREIRFLQDRLPKMFGSLKDWTHPKPDDPVNCSAAPVMLWHGPGKDRFFQEWP